MGRWQQAEVYKKQWQSPNKIVDLAFQTQKLIKESSFSQKQGRVLPFCTETKSPDLLVIC